MAQLAYEEKWWALTNLLIRKEIAPEQERLKIYKGRNAIGWAKQHGQTWMNCQLRRFFYSK
jgi:hypothetical protein